MKRFITIISAGIIALLSLNSCHIEWADDSYTADAVLTCEYAGGLPTVVSEHTYELEDTYLYDKEIEDIFYHLSEVVSPGFIRAFLDIKIYDAFNNLRKARLYEFWWEIDPYTGEGYYAWDEIKE